jgi:hypothetical protein
MMSGTHDGADLCPLNGLCLCPTTMVLMTVPTIRPELSPRMSPYSTVLMHGFLARRRSKIPRSPPKSELDFLAQCERKKRSRKRRDASASVRKPRTGWDILPLELMLEILSKLDWEECWRLRGVCRAVSSVDLIASHGAF